MSSLRARPHQRPDGTNKEISERQEGKAAKRLGGKVTKGSGNTPWEKGDVRLQRVARLECKVTRAASFRVTEEIIDKIEAATAGADEVPILEIELASGRRVYVVPAWAMDDLLEKAAQGKA